MKRVKMILGLGLLLAACTAPAEAPLPIHSGEALAPLPHPITNNATTALQVAGGGRLYSFLGLGAGKTHTDTQTTAFCYDLAQNVWREIPPVPGPGRIAGVAVAVQNHAYIFGGYTVAEDGSEKSVPSVHRFDPVTETYTELPPMPTPVDDTVALVYQERYIYLVSGWHDTDNVDLVQIYDTETQQWHDGTPYPGAPVFGHAGGIVGHQLLIADGVKVVPLENGRRRFAASDEVFLGTISAADFTQIDWHPIPAHEGPARYRMAATGVASSDRILFVGGSDNPYNYNGIGYNGEPALPLGTAFAFNLKTRTWASLGDVGRATMDHRNLVHVEDRFFLIGGMIAPQQVSDQVWVFELQ